MKRSGFKQPIRTDYARQQEREPKPNGVLERPFNGAVITDEVNGQPKEDAIYSEPYRRLVAALPCINCGIEGFSQAAHPMPTAKGRKEDDRRCFPLCGIHYFAGALVIGCHTEFDTYQAMTRIAANEAAIRYGIATRHTIRLSGMWPKGMPHMEEQLELEKV
jgi:hypothetical protein